MALNAMLGVCRQGRSHELCALPQSAALCLALRHVKVASTPFSELSTSTLTAMSMGADWLAGM